MSSIELITNEQIYNKIMFYLCLHKGNIYNQYELYKNIFNNNDLNLKYNYIIVLRNITIKEITLWKYEGVYYISYLSLLNDIVNHIPIDHSWINEDQLNIYIINNHIQSEFTYKDLETGDTVFHILFRNPNNYYLIHNFINKYPSINYTIKNKNFKTPIEEISSVQIATCIVNNLNNKIIDLQNTHTNLETSLINKVNALEIDFLNKISTLEININNHITEINNKLTNIHITRSLYLIFKYIGKYIINILKPIIKYFIIFIIYLTIIYIYININFDKLFSKYNL